MPIIRVSAGTVGRAVDLWAVMLAPRGCGDQLEQGLRQPFWYCSVVHPAMPDQVEVGGRAADGLQAVDQLGSVAVPSARVRPWPKVVRCCWWTCRLSSASSASARRPGRVRGGWRPPGSTGQPSSELHCASRVRRSPSPRATNSCRSARATGSSSPTSPTSSATFSSSRLNPTTL